MCIESLRKNLKLTEKQIEEKYYFIVIPFILLFILGIILLVLNILYVLEVVSYTISIFIIAFSLIVLLFVDKRFRNPFIIISILLVCFTIILGVSVLTIGYKSQLPIRPHFFTSNYNVSVSLECYSGILKKDTPIIGDYFYCYGKIQNTYNMSFRILPANIRDINLLNKNESVDTRYCSDYPFSKSINELKPNSTLDCLIVTEMGSGDLHEKRIEFVFVNDSADVTPIDVSSNWESFIYTPISETEYNNRQNQRLLFFFSIVLLPFTSFGGIKALMDIWDRKKPRVVKQKKKKL